MMQPMVAPMAMPTSSPIQKSKAFSLVAVQKADEDKRFVHGDVKRQSGCLVYFYITRCVIDLFGEQGSFSLKIFKNAWFGRFARKEKIPAKALWDAALRAENGQIDADLGGGVIKQRIACPGECKSKGYRSVMLFRKGETAFFVYGFPKSELGNIREDEEEQFKKNGQIRLRPDGCEVEEIDCKWAV